MPDYGLGRVPQPVDEQDKMFPLSRAMSAATITRTYKYWPSLARLDQNGFPHCVGYSCTHLRSGSPVRIAGLQNSDADRLYFDCKAVDGYPGDGTWVRVAAQIMREQGFISTYLWAQNMDEVKTWLLTKGPLVVGTVWTDKMFRPGIDGLLDISGEIVGGHAYLIDGINVTSQKARIMNSWGLGWGLNGRAWLKLADLESLIFDLDGECLAALEA